LHALKVKRNTYNNHYYVVLYLTKKRNKIPPLAQCRHQPNHKQPLACPQDCFIKKNCDNYCHIDRLRRRRRRRNLVYSSD
jgi:hypothetical protein